MDVFIFCWPEAMVDWKITVGDPDWDIKTPSTDAGDAQQLLRGKRHRTTICQIHLKSQGLAAMQMHWLGGGKLRALEVLETCGSKAGFVDDHSPPSTSLHATWIPHWDTITLHH